MGISIFIESAYRSVDQQIGIIRRRLKAGQKLEEILCVSAPPGYCEHHAGGAVDIGTGGVPMLTVDLDQTLAFA